MQIVLTESEVVKIVTQHVEREFGHTIDEVRMELFNLPETADEDFSCDMNCVMEVKQD